MTVVMLGVIFNPLAALDVHGLEHSKLMQTGPLTLLEGP